MSFTSILKRFKRKSPAVVPVQIQIVRVEPQTMNLAQWCSRPELVQQSIELAKTHLFRAQLDILNNEHPARLVFKKTGASETDRIAHQGQVEGYEICMANIRAMASMSKPKVELGEPTFEPIKE